MARGRALFALRMREEARLRVCCVEPDFVGEKLVWFSGKNGAWALKKLFTLLHSNQFL